MRRLRRRLVTLQLTVLLLIVAAAALAWQVWELRSQPTFVPDNEMERAYRFEQDIAPVEGQIADLRRKLDQQEQRLNSGDAELQRQRRQIQLLELEVSY